METTCKKKYEESNIEELESRKELKLDSNNIFNNSQINIIGKPTTHKNLESSWFNPKPFWKRTSVIVNEEKKKTTLDLIQELNEIYENFERVREKSAKLNVIIGLILINKKNADFGKGLPNEIQKTLKKQENALITQKKDDYLTDLLCRHLAHKSRKKEQDLLIYKSDQYRIKRELDNIIENKQNLFERYGKNNW